MYYNFCRIHQSLRVTPAMEAGMLPSNLAPMSGSRMFFLFKNGKTSQYASPISTSRNTKRSAMDVVAGRANIAGCNFSSFLLIVSNPAI
jgi:hypothetical protein